jgi:glycerophosphoryl diester phosphodiesterase
VRGTVRAAVVTLPFLALLLWACGQPPAVDVPGDAGETASADAERSPPDASPAPPPDASMPADAAVDPCERDGRYADERCDLDCDQPDPDCRFDVIAHRGSAFRRPENTLPAYQRAMDEGADALELDVNLTLDGVVVIWHDRDPDAPDALAREAGLEGLPWRPYAPYVGDPLRRPVETLALSQLRANYGYAHTATGQPDPAAIIPTFADFAAWSQAAPHLRALYVDVKLAADQLALARDLSEKIADLCIGSRYEVFLMSPREPIVLEMRSHLAIARPAHRLRFIFDFEQPGALSGARRLGTDALSTGKPLTGALGDFLAELEDIVSHRDEPPRLDPVVAWTFDEDDDLVAVLGTGVDGIMTDRPADLGRQVFRGFADHRRLADAALACAQGHSGQAAKAMCLDGIALGLFAPLREKQVVDWVCNAAGVSAATQDLFGCLFLSPDHVRFAGDPERAVDQAVWYEPPASVVVGDPALY